MDANPLYAKSDGTTLEQHTAHVVEAMRAIARPLLPGLTPGEYEIALRGAVLHDLGKAHPVFQQSLAPDFAPGVYRHEVCHRHEISSLLFLPLFDGAEWPLLIDMVAAHHKSLHNLTREGKGKGLADLVERYGADAVFARHFEGWDRWHPAALALLPRFGIAPRPVTQTEARAAFDAVCEHCEQRRSGRSAWRGLLMAADHLASALQEETSARIPALFQTPDLRLFHARAEQACPELYPLAKRSSEGARPHTLVIAPTGAGKTDFLLRRCSGGRVFYLLPFQASINALFVRLERALNGTGDARLPAERRTDIRRVHAAAQIEIEDGMAEETLLQRHPGAALKIMTPHQIAALIFGLAGHEAVALDIAGQNVILDEVHVYGEQTQAMVLELVKALVRLGCRVHIGSATIPSRLAQELRACLGGEAAVEDVRLTDVELAGYDRHTVHLLDDEAIARLFVSRSLRANKRVLFISNRVGSAQERYRWACETFPDVPALLLHSRFRRGDRARLEGRIEAFDQSDGPCLVCSTQVVEVSLDISFDTLVSDCAPLDSLIQRFGRVNRRRGPAAERRLAPVGVIAPPAGEPQAKPYALDVLQRSWAALPRAAASCGTSLQGAALPVPDAAALHAPDAATLPTPDAATLHETSLQGLIDGVYPTLSVLPIEVHVVEYEHGVQMPQLCHYPRSVLLESLEIDSACVVRACDAAEYRMSRGSARQELEIPVPLSALRARFETWKPLEVGNRPFVCPDACYDGALGLLLGEMGGEACTNP